MKCGTIRCNVCDMNDEKDKKPHQSSEMKGLSDLMRLLNLTVDIYHNAKICGDWQVEQHELGATCFHMVTMGDCMLHVAGHLDIQLTQGDLVFFPRELPHYMSSVTASKSEQNHLDYKQATDVAGTGMLCGSVRFQHHVNHQFLDALPPVFVIPKRNNHQWLTSLANMILLESVEASPSSSAILDKLSELLLIYAIRQYISDHPVEVGMLALFGHERLAKTVHAIHQEPSKAWTLEAMAYEASLSRTSFAETFKKVSGWTPGHYLTWWRMQLAWKRLNNGDRIISVSESVGYQSEAAFSRAFKKIFSISPSKVRKGLQS